MLCAKHQHFKEDKALVQKILNGDVKMNLYIVVELDAHITYYS
jgi:hypothetical protein